MYSFSPRNSTSFFLWPISENGNSIHQDLKKEAQVTCTILPFLSPLPFYDCEIYPSASEISELTSFHVHFLFTHEATIIFHLLSYQQYSLIRLSLSRLGPFLPSMGNTTVLMFWKANLVTWLPSFKLFNKSHCSQENSTILWALFTCPGSLCKHLYNTIYSPPQTEPLFLVSQITHALSHWKHHTCCFISAFSLLTSVLHQYLQWTHMINTDFKSRLPGSLTWFHCLD